ncbi:alpha/beta hydrolase [Candidatus Woesearchaeota archaeon]|nr:alpha/beta hydrolase [Candidatus Woesearchaeota archaeon]
MPEEGKFLELGQLEGVGDLKIYYEILSGHPPIVFLHGVTSNHTMFHPYIKHFNQNGFGTLAYDHRGDGKSTHISNPKFHSPSANVSDLEHLLGAEGIEHATLIGQSLGGMIAQFYAIEHPSRVDALVLVSTSYDLTKTYGRTALNRFVLKIDPVTRAALNLLNTAVGLFIPDGPAGGIYTDSREDYYPDFSEKTFREKPEAYFLFAVYGKNSAAYVRAMHALTGEMMKWSTERLAPLISAPTLIIHGQSDPLIPVATAHELNEMIRNSRKEIVPGGHAIVYRKPEILIPIIDRFLTGEIYSERLRANHPP